MNTPNLQLALNGQSSKVKVGFIDSNMDAIYLASRLVKVGFKLAVLDLNGGFTKSIKYGVCDEKFRKPLKLIDRGIKRGLLSVSNDNLALKDCPLIFIFTEIGVDEKGKADYLPLERSCRIAGDLIQRGSIVIVSTKVFPGTSEKVVKKHLENRSGMKASVDFGLAYASFSVDESPIILASSDEDSLHRLTRFFEGVTGRRVVTASSIAVAEAASLLETLYQNVTLAFSNESADLCTAIGLDFLEVKEVLKAKGVSRMVNPNLTNEESLNFFRRIFDESKLLNLKLSLSKAATRTNDYAVKRLLSLIRAGLKLCNKTVRRSKILIMGFLSTTGFLYKVLYKRGMDVEIYTSENSFKWIEDLGLKFQSSLDKALKGKDCLIILSDKSLESLKLWEVKHLVDQPALIVDLTNRLDPEEALKEGFVYASLSRGILSR
ncbi:hypothetical protein J7L06_06100 [Candidatus Bathyarchaeota archaeon]|nr:hypothetical protein [Candidatus Bathyarchaeota archaeon]